MNHIFLKTKSPIICFLSMLIVVLSCTNRKTTNGLSATSKKYIAEVIALLETKSIKKKNINWEEFKKDVFLHAKNSQTIADTYPTIEYAINRLGDHHSYFLSMNKQATIEQEKFLPSIHADEVIENIGYVRIPYCIGNEEMTNQYISNITRKIANQNKPNIKGWIIDLRDNFGGNMWPMLVTIGPFLHNGVQGYFLDADKRYIDWRYQDGKAYLDNVMLAENKIAFTAYRKSKIAVLMNSKTASSGEAIAVVLKGYSNTKLFGQPSFGVSTGCESYTLSDGSRINLATSIFVDKNKQSYGTIILPDSICDDREILSKAIRWVSNK